MIRTIRKVIEIREKKVLIGTYKENATYTEHGKKTTYHKGGYTTHYKGEQIIIDYTENLPEFIEQGSFRESIIHKVPTKDLDWTVGWKKI